MYAFSPQGDFQLQPCTRRATVIRSEAVLASFAARANRPLRSKLLQQQQQQQLAAPAAPVRQGNIEKVKKHKQRKDKERTKEKKDKVSCRDCQERCLHVALALCDLH